jgi:hypothetical protein
MFLNTSRSEVQDLVSGRFEGVGNQAAVTLPPQGFRTEDDDALSGRLPEESLAAGGKRGRLHVIGVDHLHHVNVFFFEEFYAAAPRSRTAASKTSRRPIRP